MSKQVDVTRPKSNLKFYLTFLLRIICLFGIDSKGNTLLLDLDETLIHSCSLRDGPDHIVVAHSDKGEETKVFFNIKYSLV